MSDDISKRQFATPKRRLNRSGSNLSTGESKVPNPLNNLSFNFSSGNNTQQQQQQQPAFNIGTSPPQQSPFTGVKPATNPPTFSFGGGNNTPFQPPTSSPPTAVGFGNKPVAAASPFGNTPATPSFSTANVASPFGTSKPPSAPSFTPTFGTTPPSSSAPSLTFNASPFGNTQEKAPPMIPSFGTNTSASSVPTDTSKPFTFNAPVASTTPGQPSEKENKTAFSTMDKESDKKENVPLSSNDNKKDEKAPMFSFNAPKKDDGLFGKPTTPLFGPLSTNKKRENTNDEVTEPSTKKVMFTSTLPTIEEKKKDNVAESEAKKDDKKETKKVTFSFGSDKKENEKQQPSVSLAFSTKKDGDKEDNTTLSVSAEKSDTTTAPVVCKITDPSQITKKTFFYELPEVAQKELAEFSHFITSQAEKMDKAALDTEFTIGSRVRAMKSESTSLNNDAEITLKQLGYLNEKVNDLIQKNNTHRVNIKAAQLMQEQGTKDWRLRGAAESWSYFKDMVDMTQKRLDHYKASIHSIEETVNTMQANAAFTPAKVGSVIESQGKILLSLAGRVAEIHEQLDRIASKK